MFFLRLSFKTPLKVFFIAKLLTSNKEGPSFISNFGIRKKFKKSIPRYEFG